MSVLTNQGTHPHPGPLMMGGPNAYFFLATFGLHMAPGMTMLDW